MAVIWATKTTMRKIMIMTALHGITEFVAYMCYGLGQWVRRSVGRCIANRRKKQKEKLGSWEVQGYGREMERDWSKRMMLYHGYRAGEAGYKNALQKDLENQSQNGP